MAGEIYFTTNEVISLGVSDLVSGNLISWLANSVAHLGIGMFAYISFIPKVTLLQLIAMVVVTGTFKEIFWDIQNAKGSAIVLLDSVWDVLCYLVGIWLVFNHDLKGGAAK